MTDIDLADAATWCDLAGIAVENGSALVYKYVDADFNAGHNHTLTAYRPGETVTATDWNPVAERGGGLHFGPSPKVARNLSGAALGRRRGGCCARSIWPRRSVWATRSRPGRVACSMRSMRSERRCPHDPPPPHCPDSPSTANSPRATWPTQPCARAATTHSTKSPTPSSAPLTLNRPTTSVWTTTWRRQRASPMQRGRPAGSPGRAGRSSSTTAGRSPHQARLAGGPKILTEWEDWKHFTTRDESDSPLARRPSSASSTTWSYS